MRIIIEESESRPAVTPVSAAIEPGRSEAINAGPPPASLFESATAAMAPSEALSETESMQAGPHCH